MADIIFRGDDDAVAQVNTVTPGGTIGTETFTCTINGKSITYTATGGDVVADVVDGLVAAWNNSTIPEFAEITAADATTHMTLTADTAGVPFTQTSAATGSATLVTATSTANDGPNVLDAANCTGGALPGGGDSFFFQNLGVNMTDGLDQSAAGTLAVLSYAASYTGQIGRARINTTGSSNYYEYRGRYYAVRASVCYVGWGAGTGSARIMLDFGAVQTAITVWKTASSSESGYHALRLKGTHASNTLDAMGGTIDIAPEGGETATIATLTASGSAQVRTGLGTTLTTVNASGSSQVHIRSATGLSDITTINVLDSSRVTIEGDNAVTTANVLSGRMVNRASGTITNLNIGSKGIFDLTDATEAITITNCTIAPGAQILDPQSLATWTNGIAINLAGIEDVKLSLGKNITITPS